MRRSLIAAGTTAAATLIALLAGSPASDAADRITPGLWAAYSDAIRDSAVSTPAEVVHDLAAPVPSDPLAQWKEIDGEQYVLVSALRHSPVSTVDPGQPFTLDGDRWVTLPREVERECRKAGCAHMTAARLDLRLKELIGLPPDADYHWVTRFWVRPADLFRPCTDPRITSTTCPQQAPDDAPSTVGPVDVTKFLWNQANYAWRVHGKGTRVISCAADWKDASGGRCIGFPWTRLGYTYDWAPAAKDHRGVTEFIVVHGAQAYLESSGPQSDYYGAR